MVTRDYYKCEGKFYLANLWRRMAGFPEKHLCKLESLDQMKTSEWSSKFEEAMRVRLVMGRIRYGKLRDQNKGSWDRMDRIIKEVELYHIDGNDERLVDIANMALLEFEEGVHPRKCFMAKDDTNHNKEIRVGRKD